MPLLCCSQESLHVWCCPFPQLDASAWAACHFLQASTMQQVSQRQGAVLAQSQCRWLATLFKQERLCAQSAMRMLNWPPPWASLQSWTCCRVFLTRPALVRCHLHKHPRCRARWRWCPSLPGPGRRRAAGPALPSRGQLRCCLVQGGPELRQSLAACFGSGRRWPRVPPATSGPPRLPSGVPNPALHR